MDPVSTTSSSVASSTVTDSTISSLVPPPPPPLPYHILEISLISAQDLAPVSKPLRAYAVAWIQPARKVTTRTDQNGHTNPTWNERFEFRMENELLLAEDTNITVEIYSASWFREILVGTVRVVMSDLIMPLQKVVDNELKNTRFVALQVRRPSGTPEGILNLGVSILDNTKRSKRYAENSLAAALKRANSLSVKERRNGGGQVEEEDTNGKSNRINEPQHLLNMGFDLNNGSMVNGSACNGSMVNGSEVCSDIGPSASIVAAEMAIKSRNLLQQNNNMNQNTQEADDTGSSILEDLTMEEAKAKGYRIRSKDRSKKGSLKQYSTDDESELSAVSTYSRHSRRNSDGGLFSCFGNVYGIEVSIVCGASKSAAGGNKMPKAKSRSRSKRTSESKSKTSSEGESKTSSDTISS